MTNLKSAYISMAAFVHPHNNITTSVANLPSLRSKNRMNPFFEGSPKYGFLKHQVDDLIIHTLSRSVRYFTDSQLLDQELDDVIYAKKLIHQKAKNFWRQDETYGLCPVISENKSQDLSDLIDLCTYHEFWSEGYSGKVIIFDFLTYVWHYKCSNGMNGSTQYMRNNTTWILSHNRIESELDPPLTITLTKLGNKIERIILQFNNPLDRYIIVFEEFGGDKDQFVNDLVMSKLTYA